jgi:ATP-dependent helicase HrpA
VAPGTCIRLYSEEDFAGRPPFTEPEILRTNLASVILQMASLGLGDVAAFPFVEPPDARAITDGIVLLEELGALERAQRAGAEVRLTRMGRRLARLPVDPRLARMVLEAERNGCVAEVLVIAAGLSIQDPRERPRDAPEKAAELHRRFDQDGSDFLSYLSLWRYLREEQRELGSSAFRRMCKSELLHHLRVREWQDLHSQLRQITRGIGLEVRPLAHEVDGDAVHESLLAGLLSHIGMWDEERKEYRGARETRFVLAGGTALGKRRPKWVMAAELVETNRLRARTVAAVRPERIERVAGHLVTRSHGEPWWDRDRGASLVEERVSLYGLPVVPRRRVGYERVDPADAREMFLRHALVEGEWDAPHAFLAANHERLVEVLALEHRVRRDLFVGEDALVDWFAARVPEEVTTGRRFDRWWKGARTEHPELLTLTQRDLIDPAVEAIDHDAYPDWIELGATHLPVTYTDQRGDDLDGVSVDVPLVLLDQAEGLRLDWQVSGFREELVSALIRTLPKDVRRHVTPVADTARSILATSGPADGPLLEVLAAELARRAGVPVRLSRANLEQVPDHLRVTYRAVDDRGRPIAWSKDLPALRARMRARRRAAVAAAAPMAEVEGLRAWTVGAIPRSLAITHDGQPLTAHPTLVDEGDSVALRVVPTEAEQRVAMWGGTRRLLLLQLGSPLRTLDKALPNATKLALAASAHLRPADVYQQAASAAVDQLLLEAGGPVWDEAAFTALLKVVKARFAPVAVAAATVVGDIAAVVASIDDRLATMLAPALDDTVVDAQAHLDRLLHPGWITAAGVDRLPDVLRYVQGLEHRLTKAVGQPDRDRVKIPPVKALEREYARLAPRDVDGSVRTMLEELRVATFAQPLAKGGVSEQKVRKALGGL